MQLINQIINGYSISTFINKGTFGSVYKAIKNDVEYAIKVFEEAYVLQEFKVNGENNRLKREIEIIKSVDHESLVKYVDDFVIENETGRSHFLVMEFVEGMNLQDKIDQTGLLSEVEGIGIFKQILKGIDYLHNSKGEGDDIGIIHRDLKPANILIRNDGKIKVSDFGLAKAIDFTSITTTGDSLGSPIYKSPEQITDSKHIDKRSDFYTLGVILYKMLTGEYPYDFQDIDSLYEQIKNVPAIPPRRRYQSISNKIENVILKLLEKNPYQRFNKISDILEAIDSVGEKNEAKLYDLSPKFFLRLYNDKSVLEDFTQRNKEFGWVVFPANLENVKTCKGLLKKIQDDDNIKIIIDPATVRLAYSAYTDTEGVRELPYAPKDYSVITPDYLKHYSDQKNYVKLVLDKQIELKANRLISPFHYIHNSSFGFGPNRNLIEEWFDLDCKLTKESIDYRNANFPDKEIYMGVCIKADFLNDATSKKYFLNSLSVFDVDGYLIYADGIDNKSNEGTLYNYIEFLIELQTWSQKPVIAGRINAGLGLGLLSVGISGFTSGTARFESFYEGLYNESGESYNMYVRYFFPELLTTIPITRKSPTKFEEIVSIIGTCNCFYCIDKSNLEIIKDKTAHLHFLENIYGEISEIKRLEARNRIDNFLLKIETAIVNYSSLRAIFKTDDYSFLNKWKNVFIKIKEKYYV